MIILKNNRDNLQSFITEIYNTYESDSFLDYKYIKNEFNLTNVFNSYNESDIHFDI